MGLDFAAMSGSSVHPAACVDLVAIEVPVRLEFTERTRWLVDGILTGWADCAALAVEPTTPAPETVITLIDPDELQDLPDVASALVVRDERAALTDLASRITIAAIGVRGGELVLLHGCAVADPRTGAVAAFVAPSGTGKTTFSRTLAGKWSYVTDETVAVEFDGVVRPYPKPLSIIEEGYSAGTKTQTPVGSLGIEVAEHPALRLCALSLLDRQPDHEGVTVTKIDTVDALAMLAPESSYLTRIPKPMHTLAALIDGAGGLQRLTYAEVADLEPVVAAQLARLS
jgi:hypothetical protein